MATAVSAHRVCDTSIWIDMSAVSLIRNAIRFHVIGDGTGFELKVPCVPPRFPTEALPQTMAAAEQCRARAAFKLRTMIQSRGG